MSRRPLSELPSWDDSRSNTPTPKKARRSMSKRVSFGGQEIKHYYAEQHQSPEEQIQRENTSALVAPVQTRPPSPRKPPSSPRHRGGSPVSSDNRPPLSPRRSPRLARTALAQPQLPAIEENDDEEDHSTTLSIQVPAVESVLPDLVELNRMDTTISPTRYSPVQALTVTEDVREDTFTSEQFLVPTSSPSIFMDEDVEAGVPASRLSVHGGGGGDDTTVVISRKISRISCDSDITARVPRLSELLDLDEAYHKSPRGRESIGDITMGIPSLSDLAEDAEQRAIAEIHEPQPVVNLNNRARRESHIRPSVKRSFKEGVELAALELPIQPVLPETRQLFSDADEDTVTIHEKCSPQVEEKLAAPHKEHDLEETEPSHPVPRLRSLAELLDVVEVQFRDDCMVLHDAPSSRRSRGRASLAIANHGDSERPGEDETLSTRLYNAVTSETMLKILLASAKQLRTDIQEKRNSIEELTAKIEHQQPEFLNFPKERPQLSKFASTFKRLRKMSAMYAVKQHRLLRKEREVNVRAAVCNQIMGLEMDKEVLSRSSALCRGESDNLKRTMEANNLATDSRQSAQMDPTLLSTLRSEAQDCLRTLTHVRKYPIDASMREARTEIDGVMRQNCVLENEAGRLENLTMSKDNTRQLVASDRLSHQKISLLSCVKPITMGCSQMHLRLCNMSVHFQIQGQLVTNISVAENEKSRVPDIVRHGLRAVHSTCLSQVTALNQVPRALQLSIAYLTKLKMAADGVSEYARTRELEYIGSECASNTAEMTVRGQYYSSKKRCIFSVTLALTAVAPTLLLNQRQRQVWHDMEVSVLSVDVVLGECPKASDILRAISAHRAPIGDALHEPEILKWDLQPLSDALRGIWKLVE